MNPRTSRTHVYLPGLAAHDTSHGRAAFEELNKTGVTAGSIFVDTVEAQAVMRARYVSHIDSKLNSSRALAKLSTRELRSLREQRRNAHNAVRVINHGARAAPGNNALDSGPADVLWVKGHGNANNANSISTRVEYQVDQNTIHDGPTQRNLTVKRGYKQVHTADQIANSVRHITAMLKPPAPLNQAPEAHGLDVRISSCGSAGTVRRDPVGGVVPPEPPNFAKSVSSALDAQGANPRIRVSGFIGDTNSSHPVRGQFRTKVKQRVKQAAVTPAMENAFTRLRAKARVAPDARQAPIKHRVNPNAVGVHRLGVPIQGMMNHLAPRIPVRRSVSAALRATVQPFTKIELSTPGETKPEISVPRSRARVQVPRG